MSWVNVKINYQPNHYFYYLLIFMFDICNDKANHFLKCVMLDVA